MRFGIFYEHQLPRPWAEDAEEKLLTDALEQVELADTRRHRLRLGGRAPLPRGVLALERARGVPRGRQPADASNIRLGHGIVQLPPGFNHPARVAERIATLDLISGGRVEFGTGESSSQAELGGFGVDRETQARAVGGGARRDHAHVRGGAVRRLRRPAGISMPPRNVVPKPKQKPHPPLWVACSRRETILLAARRGIGALTFAFIEPEQAKEWVDEYYALIAVGRVRAGRLRGQPELRRRAADDVHEDEETAIERGIDGAHFFGYSLAHYYVFGDHRPGVTNVWEEFQAKRAEYGFAREIINADDGPLGVKILAAGARLAARRDRHARAGRRAGPALRGRGRRPGDLRAAGRAEPARAHLRVARAVRQEGAAAVHRRARGARGGQARAAAPRRASARWPGARRPAHADPDYVITPRGEPRPAQVIAAARRAASNGAANGRPATAGSVGSAAASGRVGVRGLRARAQRRAARAHRRVGGRACG